MEALPMTDPHHDRRWLILGVIGIAQLLVVLDVTIVNIALPSAQDDLGFSDESRQWIITAYALAFGSLLLLGGRIADLLGRKWTSSPACSALPVHPRSAAPRRASACWSRRARCRAFSPRCWRPPRCRCSPPRSPTRPSAARRSASTARSRAPAARSACCSAACSPRCSTGADACTCRSCSRSPAAVAGLRPLHHVPGRVGTDSPRLD